MNAIVFQQVSLIAASSIARSMIVALGLPAKRGDIALHAFPNAERLRVAGDDILLATGLSANKLATLRRVADALVSGGLDEATLELTAQTQSAYRCWTTVRTVVNITLSENVCRTGEYFRSEVPQKLRFNSWHPPAHVSVKTRHIPSERVHRES